MTKGDHIDNLVLHTGKKLISSIWNPTNLKQKDQPYRTNGQMIQAGYREDTNKKI